MQILCISVSLRAVYEVGLLGSYSLSSLVVSVWIFWPECILYVKGCSPCQFLVYLMARFRCMASGYV